MNKLEKGNILMKLLKYKTFNGCYFDMNKYYIPELFLDDVMNYRFELLSHSFLDTAISELNKLNNTKYHDNILIKK